MLTCRPLPLPLQTPFRTAHGTDRTRTNALVELTGADGRSFFGEGALPPYYPHDGADVQSYVEALDAAALLDRPPFALEAALARLPDGGPPPARCAVDLALHDRWAQALGRPLHELLGLDTPRMHRRRASRSRSRATSRPCATRLAPSGSARSSSSSWAPALSRRTSAPFAPCRKPPPAPPSAWTPTRRGPSRRLPR